MIEVELINLAIFDHQVVLSKNLTIGNLAGDLILDNADLFYLPDILLKNNSTGSSWEDIGQFFELPVIIVYTIFGDPVYNWRVLQTDQYKLNLCKTWWKSEGFKFYDDQECIEAPREIQYWNYELTKTIKMYEPKTLKNLTEVTDGLLDRRQWNPLHIRRRSYFA